MYRCIAITLSVAAGLMAQEFRGNLSGRVTDQQRVVVPNARITVTESETGARYSTVSGADGGYALPFLSPGQYVLTAEATGFRRFVIAGVRVGTGGRKQLDMMLEVGGVDQAVTILRDSEVLESGTASSGQSISQRQVGNLPMNGRTPLILAQLASGVTPNTDPRLSRPFDNTATSDFSMAGAPARANELLLDGAPDTTGNNRIAYSPPVDAVQEVKVETFQSDAAFGHTGGGTVNVVLRGGTNQVHGAVYDFNQVSALAASPWFTNRAGQPKPASNFNQWGINGGGPLRLPGQARGRERVFWYFAYEGIRDSFPDPLTSTVPTAAERSGDFSALLRVSANYQIYDPLTGVPEGARVRRQPFGGNLIPANRLSNIARNYLQFYPQPNQPGRGDGQDNYLANSVRSDIYDNELVRLDFNLSERHKFFWNFRHNDRVEDRGNRFQNLATGNLLSRVNWGTMVDDVYAISPTTVLNTRLNWTRFIEGNDRPSAGYDFTQLGFPAYLAAASRKLVLPNIDLSPFTSLGDNAGDRTPFDIFQIFVSVTKIKGRHSLKFGADLREYRESSSNYGNASGSYQFRGDFTRGPFDNSPGAPLGQDLAAFLLGYPTAGGFDLNTSRTNRARHVAFFVQDDFRLRSNLVVNMGLRFERDGPTIERFNRSVNGLDTVTANPISREALAAYARNPVAGLPADQFLVNGGLLFAGGAGRNVYSTKSGYFSPRVGLAWTPRAGKTVVRAGGGVFVFPIGTGGINQTGFNRTTPILGAGASGGLRPASTLENPFPGGILQPTGSAMGMATNLGLGLSVHNPNPLNPYSLRWNLEIERALRGDLVFQVGYIGNRSVHLPFDQQIDFVPQQYLSKSPVRDQAVIDRMTANVANPFAGLLPGTNMNGATIAFSQLVRPFPQFTGVVNQALNDGSSYFHGLTARLDKRFAHGLQFLANYQFARAIERRSRLNDFGGLEKRPADIDHPHRIVTSASYELPFGRGKALLDRIIGGWVVTGIYSYQTGAPAGVWGNVMYRGGPLAWHAREVNGAFDVTQFNRNSMQQLASNVRTFPSRFGNLRQDSMNGLDFSMLKNTPIRERFILQYRAEFFNGLNHAVFSAPQLNPTAMNFSTITSVANMERHIQMALRLSW